MKKQELIEAITPATPAPTIYYKSGCHLLDLMIGGGLGIGIPGGTIINLIGDSSSGKTFLKNEIIAANYHASNKTLAFYSDDTESGDSFDTSSLYGINLRPADRSLIKGDDGSDSQTVEELDAKLTAFLAGVPKDAPSIYAVDSLDGLQSEEQVDMAEKRAKQFELGKEVKDPGSYAMALQKFLSQHLFRGQHKKFKAKQGLFIVVSQIRDKIDGFGWGDSYTVSGGKALQFYCHTRLFLKCITKVKKRDAVIGLLVEARLIKSKTPRPFRRCRFSVWFDYGIDDIGTSIDFLYDLRKAEDGSLMTEKCSALRWGGTASPPTLVELKKWLTDNNYYEACKAYHKEQKKADITASCAMEWVEANARVKEKYLADYGKAISRGELMNLCGADPKMKKQLDDMVTAKWEHQEVELSSGRGKKYAV